MAQSAPARSTCHRPARAKRLASRPFKFTLTGPHMLAKTLLDHHYGSVPELALALADALAEQVRELDADVVQIDALEVDHIVMETAHRPAQELEVFRSLRPEIGFGLGVIDIKSTEIERADDIARSIERAEKILGPGRVTYVHPDCGFWMLKRNIADGKLRALVAGRDLYEGLRRRAPPSR